MAPDTRPGTPSSSQRPCERHGDIVDFGDQRVANGPCLDAEGRPIAHGAYVVPSPGNRALRWSIAGAVALGILLPVLYFVGPRARPNVPRYPTRTTLSPGQTSAAHNLAAYDCAQCHRAAHNVEEARCERCHDSSVSARLSNAAHVFRGTEDLAQALAAPEVACATCHREHRGAAAALASVDDRECGACHRVGAWTALTGFERHPEFALVRAAEEIGSGLRWFDHGKHIRKVQAKFQKACDACHERPARAASFSPISFARHCRTCHEEDLSDSAGTLPATVVSALGPLPPPLKAKPDPDDPARASITGFRHADPWLLRTVQTLRSAIDPTIVAAERVTLDRQVAHLELMIRFTPGMMPGAWTSAGATAAGPADAPVPTTSGDLQAALQETASAIESFVAATGSSNPDAMRAAAETARLKQASIPKSDRPTAAPGVATGVDSLRLLIDATIARARSAGDQERVARAMALRERLDQLPRAFTGQAPSGGREAQLETLLRSVAQLPDPGVRLEAVRLAYVAQIARQRASSGIDPVAFDLHRQQLLLLLDTMRRRLGLQAQQVTVSPEVNGLLARTAALERRVLGSYDGRPVELGAAEARFFERRQRERARVDTELETAGIRLSAPAETSSTDNGEVQRRYDALRLRLAAIGSATALAAPIPADAARITIAALIGQEAASADENALRKNRCTLCHELSPGGDQLAPVRVAGGSLLLAGSFTHEPHMSSEGQNCETCHTKIRGSTAARDLNVPGVMSCRACHAAGRQAAKKTGCGGRATPIT